MRYTNLRFTYLLIYLLTTKQNRGHYFISCSGEKRKCWTIFLYLQRISGAPPRVHFKTSSAPSSSPHSCLFVCFTPKRKNHGSEDPQRATTRSVSRCLIVFILGAFMFTVGRRLINSVDVTSRLSAGPISFPLLFIHSLFDAPLPR